MCTAVQYALIMLCWKVSMCYSRFPALCDHSSPGVRSSTRNENRTRDREGCNWHWSVPSATFPPSGWRSPVPVGIAAGVSLSEEDPRVRWRISPCVASLNTLWLRTGVRNGLWLAQCCTFEFHKIWKICLPNLWLDILNDKRLLCVSRYETLLYSLMPDYVDEMNFCEFSGFSLLISLSSPLHWCWSLNSNYCSGRSCLWLWLNIFTKVQRTEV